VCQPSFKSGTSAIEPGSSVTFPEELDATAERVFQNFMKRSSPIESVKINGVCFSLLNEVCPERSTSSTRLRESPRGAGKKD
jgi:hypothetical protein